MSALHSLLRERGLKPTYVVKSGSLLSLFFYLYARHDKTAVASQYPYRTFCDISEHFRTFHKNTQTSTIYICTQITN